MSRPDPSTLTRQPADEDETFVSLAHAVETFLKGLTVRVVPIDNLAVPIRNVDLTGIADRWADLSPEDLADRPHRFVSLDDPNRCFHLTEQEVEEIAKHYGAPAGTCRRKQPSLVPAMVQPMQQQRTAAASPLTEAQAMAQDDQQKPPGKGEFGGLCGHRGCTCVDARFEYIDPRGEKEAFGKFFCQGCASDKNRQVTSYRTDRDSSQACVERTIAPPKVEAPTQKKLDDHYWDLA